MLKLTIDNQPANSPPGETILTVADRMGISIPTLCHDKRLPHANACMVCLVRDIRTDRMIPACSYPVEEGMEIDASSERVRQARRDALEMLIREHFGDCEAPCRRGCPANLDISGMMRAVAGGNGSSAAEIVRETIPIPMILGEICPAPCENVCRRKGVDSSLHIREIKGTVGALTEVNWAKPSPDDTSVAVVGGGPAGVSTAYFLKQKGYGVTIYEREKTAWEPLAGKVGGKDKNKTIRDEYEKLESAGLSFVYGRQIETRDDILALSDCHAAVVLAGGDDMRRDIECWRMQSLKGRCATSLPHVFICGAARRDCGKMAVRAVADAQMASKEVDAFLSGNNQSLPKKKRFDSRAGTLTEKQLKSLAAGSIAEVDNSELPEILDSKKAQPGKIEALSSINTGLDSQAFNHQTIGPSNHPISEEAARQEAGRCMDCGCRAGETCKLRDYADHYHVSLPRAHPPAVVMELPLIIREHPDVMFEPGKCIHCGLCARLAEAEGEPYGLTFLGRGRESHLAPPLGVSWTDALTFSAHTCADMCPTGALTLRDALLKIPIQGLAD